MKTTNEAKQQRLDKLRAEMTDMKDKTEEQLGAIKDQISSLTTQV